MAGVLMARSVTQELMLRIVPAIRQQPVRQRTACQPPCPDVTSAVGRGKCRKRASKGA